MSSVQNLLNDERWHFLKISASIMDRKEDSTLWLEIELEVDSKRVAQTQPISFVDLMKDNRNERSHEVAFFGGTDESTGISIHGFQGCIASIEINSQLINLDSFIPVDERKVSISNCEQGLF